MRKPFQQVCAAKTDADAGDRTGHGQNNHVVRDLRCVKQDHRNYSLPHVMRYSARGAHAERREYITSFENRHNQKVAVFRSCFKINELRRNDSCDNAYNFGNYSAYYKI